MAVSLPLHIAFLINGILLTLQAKVLFRVDSKTLAPDRVGMKINHFFLHFYVTFLCYHIDILV